MEKFKVGDKVTLEEIRQLLKGDDRKFVKRTLQKNEKVFIHPSSKIPRRKFKENYPDNPIVYTIDKADILIGTMYNYIDYHSIFLTGIPHSWSYDSERILDSKTIEKANKVVELHNFNKSDKPLIEDTDILYKGAIPRTMNDNEYETIAKMLGSTDKEMLNLGMEMLLGFDSITNEKNYVLLLAQVRNCYLIKKSRIFNSIKKTLKTKYVNLR